MIIVRTMVSYICNNVTQTGMIYVLLEHKRSVVRYQRSV